LNINFQLHRNSYNNSCKQCRRWILSCGKNIGPTDDNDKPISGIEKAKIEALQQEREEQLIQEAEQQATEEAKKDQSK
jgi:hypothetical protein